MGLSWILAFIGVFLRDVAQVIGLLTTALMFMSPIFYPASALPETYRPYLYMNPLTTIIEQTRNALFWGITPDFTALAVYLIGGLAFACLGFALFQKTRKGFADVL
jgi:lipopolysaccharide transport system permease protein